MSAALLPPAASKAVVTRHHATSVAIFTPPPLAQSSKPARHNWVVGRQRLLRKGSGLGPRGRALARQTRSFDASSSYRRPKRGAFLLALGKPAGAESIVSDIPLAGGGSERVSFTSPANPAAILVMFSGGDGTVEIAPPARSDAMQAISFSERSRCGWVSRLRSSVPPITPG